MATASSLSTRRLKIGIIGFGPLAQFLAKTMQKQGHTLRSKSDPDYSDLCAHLGIFFYRLMCICMGMDEFLGLDNDVILLCTSILSLLEVVKSMSFHCLKRLTLFADVLSVKEYPREFLLRAVPEEFDILCTHPMFAGKWERWVERPCIHVRTSSNNEATCTSFLQIFESEFDHVRAKFKRIEETHKDVAKFIELKREDMPHQRDDSLDCGIIVLMEAEEMFEKASVSKTYDAVAVSSYRAKMIRDMLEHKDCPYHS